jgi:hypothetical protein
MKALAPMALVVVLALLVYAVIALWSIASAAEGQIQDLLERVEALERSPSPTSTTPLTLNPEGIDYRAAGIR